MLEQPGSHLFEGKFIARVVVRECRCLVEFLPMPGAKGARIVSFPGHSVEEDPGNETRITKSYPSIKPRNQLKMVDLHLK